MDQLSHTTSSPDADTSDSAYPLKSLANPRRTRLGADGRPIQGPVSTTSND